MALIISGTACGSGDKRVECLPFNPITGHPQQLIGGVCTDMSATSTTSPPVSPPTTTAVLPSTTTSTPPYPQTAEEAGVVFGVPNSLAQYRRIGQFGWNTNLSVTLKLYPGLCVDFDLNADPAQVITGQTVFVDVNAQMIAPMKSAGTIIGGATVYWSTCNRL